MWECERRRYLWRFSQHHLGRRGPERYGGGGAVRRRRWVVVNNKITIEEEGQLIIFHITRLEAFRSSWVALTGEEEPGGDGGVEDFCGRGEEEFARGKQPGGVVLFKQL